MAFTDLGSGDTASPRTLGTGQSQGQKSNHITPPDGRRGGQFAAALSHCLEGVPQAEFRRQTKGPSDDEVGMASQVEGSAHTKALGHESGLRYTKQESQISQELTCRLTRQLFPPDPPQTLGPCCTPELRHQPLS